jgi:methionine-rich copper-binding protein CopC
MRRLLAATAAAVLPLSFAIPAGLALAHAKVESVSPRKNSTRHTVREVHVTFEESVITGLIAVKKSGGTVALGRTGLKPSNHAILQWIPKQPLSPGRYTVEWRARADDGHRETGSWSFRVR